MIDLLEQAEITNKAGDALRDARVAEIEAERKLSNAKIKLLAAGVEGSNQKQRDAQLRKLTADLDLKQADCKTARITAEQKYSYEKRTLRVMELIYQIESKE